MSTALPEPPPVDARTARLVRLCEVWGKVRYLHPWVVGGAVDWDAALMAALPSALAAETDDDAAAAVRVMLEALHDPATRVEHGAEATPPAAELPKVYPATTKPDPSRIVFLTSTAAGVPDLAPRHQAAAARAHGPRVPPPRRRHRLRRPRSPGEGRRRRHGSQTAGANGDVTNLSLPGGLFVSFRGHDVRHADGRQLQRVGLRPDVEVRPTLEGIRAGRDEVLERALAFLDATK